MDPDFKAFLKVVINNRAMLLANLLKEQALLEEFNLNNVLFYG
jgi:hypothetical protein